MDSVRIHNFFFHPFNHKHAKPAKVLSAVTVVALSVLTGGLFAAAFVLVNWYDFWSELEVEPIKADPKVGKAAKVLKKSIQLESSSPAKTVIKKKEVPVRKIAAEQIQPKQTKAEHVKEAHKPQLQSFEKWAKANQWGKVHRAHYDWWMFPVERESSGYGDEYAVNTADVQALKADQEFMKNYRRGVVLVVQAWGWDLEQGKAIHPPAKGQRWTGYGVRLAKMSDSLRLFGETDLHQKLQKFFKEHCLTQKTRISDLNWLKKTLLNE